MNKKGLSQAITITLIVVVGVVVLSLFAISQFAPANATDTISVQGEATIHANPDETNFYINIEGKGADAETAKNEASKNYDKVTSGLMNAGFSKDEIKTQSFNVYPEYDYNNGNSKIKGYLATYNLIINFPASDTGKIGKAIDASIDNGASVSSIQFTLSQELQNQYKAAASKLAAEDARKKAEALASGLGKSVGNLVSVSQGTFNYPPIYAYASKGEAGATDAAEVRSNVNITPSPQDIYQSVQVVYKIK